MPCDLCKTTIKDWVGDDRKCAFDDAGIFKADNWNCATMNVLRTLADDCFYEHPPGKALYNSDQTLAVVPSAAPSETGAFIVMGWYKSRGRTEVALLIDEEQHTPLTLRAAESFISDWRKKAPKKL